MEDEKNILPQGQETDIDTKEKNADTEENKDDPQYRGKVLMQRALEQLEQGNLEEFETDRALANKYFDQIKAEAEEQEEELDALYNESRNFGIIYNVIEANVPKLLETKEGCKSLKKIVNFIKSNKVLHEQFKAYNNLMPSNKIENADEYINEALLINHTFNKNDIKENNEKLISLIKGEKLNEMVDIEDDKLDLYESIEYVTTNKKSLSNIDEFVNATKTIKESISKLPEKPIKSEATFESYVKELDKISESISNDLNAEELKLIKEVTEGNGEAYFNECKERTLNKLDELMKSEGDIQTKSRLSTIKESISNKQYDKNHAIVAIAEMIELQNTIDE